LTPRHRFVGFALFALAGCTFLTSFDPEGQPCDPNALRPESECLSDAGYWCVKGACKKGPPPPGLDAGDDDAGINPGMDAGSDAGFDGGSDAGLDGGKSDSGTDAGKTDAGCDGGKAPDGGKLDGGC